MSNTEKRSKHIPPDKHLTDYLKDTLGLERLKRKKIAVSKTLVRNNDGKKVGYMDLLLESMANLIYFFEFINEHHELLIDKFGDDIEDLLGLKPHTNPKLSVLPRFIDAIIGEGRWSDFDNQKLSYRFHLLKIIQSRINQKAMEYFANPDNPEYQKDTRYKDLIWNNLMQTEIYLRLADRFPIDKSKKPNRIIEVKVN